MRIVLLFCTALFTFSAGAPVEAGQTAKTQVMIVGVAHLLSKHDIHNSTYLDSPLSPKRQTQIDDVVARLARFRPTKVLIEAPFGDARYPNRYREYLAGRYTLTANEIYQYGFKLAARSGNRSIYPIDTWGPSLFDDNSPGTKQVDAYLNTHLKGVIDTENDAYIARDDKIQRDGTYLDDLRYLNTDAAIRANASWYSILDGMGRESNDAGSAYVAQWYTRNCYVFSNILSVIRPSDRAVVLMGQGHEYLLREFVRLDPNLTYVNPLPYLK